MKDLYLVVLCIFSLQIQAQTTIEIPVKIHLVSDANGTERLSELKALEYLCELNETYIDSEFHFYLKDGFSYVDNASIFNDILSMDARNDIEEIRDNGAINIFYASKLKSNNVSFLNAFYDYQDDWIYIQFDSKQIYKQVLGHMIAHYFGVSHCNGNSYFVNQNLDNLQDLEYQDGSNCDVAGDKICDTPPDYGVFIDSVENCIYTATVLDFKGQQIQPLVKNLMSSFYPNTRNGCDYFVFTDGQYDKMYENYNNPKRDFLKGDAPSYAMLSEQVKLVSPINLIEVDPTNGIELDWEDIDGAEKYIVEIAIDYNLTRKYQSFVSVESKIVIQDLDYGKKYIWRVTPYSDGNPCGVSWVSEKEGFKTVMSTTVDDFSKISRDFLIENPISNSINIEIIFSF